MNENAYRDFESERKAPFEAFDTVLHASTSTFEQLLRRPMTRWWKKKSESTRLDPMLAEDEVWRVIFIVLGVAAILALVVLVITLILVPVVPGQ